MNRKRDARFSLVRSRFGRVDNVEISIVACLCLDLINRLSYRWRDVKRVIRGAQWILRRDNNAITLDDGILQLLRESG